MKLDRIDLADCHDPVRLARAIHAQLGALEGPVRVVEIARGLDIAEVRIDRFDGFEGMLLTDRVRSQGAILASLRRGQRRARFTVAHELGHFLLERHVLSAETGFQCDGKDMGETRSDRRELRQETEANQFAIALLAPPHLVAPHLLSQPDLRHARRMRDALEVSLEASARLIVERHDEVLAAVWSHEGQVRYCVRSPQFPYIPLTKRDLLPQETAAAQAIAEGQRGITDWTEVSALAWTREPELELYEQTRVGAGGHAVTLLWAERPDPDGADDGGVAELDVPRVPIVPHRSRVSRIERCFVHFFDLRIPDPVRGIPCS